MNNPKATEEIDEDIAFIDIKVFEAIPGIHVLLKTGGLGFTIVAVSNDFEEELQIAREEVIGKDLFEVFPGNDYSGQLEESFLKVIQTKQKDKLPVLRYDIPSTESEFQEKYWSTTNTPILDTTGNVGYIINSAIDITQKIKLQQKEEHLQLFEKSHRLFMQAPMGIFIIKGEELVIELANGPALDMLRRTEKIIGLPLLKALPEMAGQSIAALMKEAMNTGTSHEAYEAPIKIFRDGVEELCYFNFVYQPYYENNGVISGVVCFCSEVTDKVIARSNARQSEQRFKDLIEQASVATAVYLGKEMRIQYANESMIRLWGKDASVIGKTVRAALPELEGQPFHQLLSNVFTTGETYWGKEDKGELMVDGKLQTFYFNFTYKALRNEEGVVYGILNMAIDVTEQVLIKRKIEAAQEKARLAIDSAALGSFDVDLVENKVHASPRFYEIWGTHEDYNTRENFVSLIHPDDVTIREKAHELALATGNLYYEIRILPKDGSTKWIKVTGRYIYDSSGKPYQLSGIVQDITEQKHFTEQLERQVKERTRELEEAHTSLVTANTYLQKIVNKFETAIVSLLPVYEGEELVDFTFKLCNNVYSNYSNLLPSEHVGRRVSEVFPEYYKTDAFRKYAETYITGSTNSWELHYNVDGLDVYLEITASKMDEEVIVNFTDFTRLKTLQLDLLRKIEELQNSNKNLEQFAFAASHDLKEPVRKIHIFTDRLRNTLWDRLTKEEQHYFTRLEVGTKRMSSLIQDLLTFSQLSVVSNEWDVVDLDKLMQQVIADWDIKLEEKEAVITVSYLGEIKGFPRQLEQVFNNLIGNALTYSRPDVTPEISVRGRQTKGHEIRYHLSLEEQKKTFYAIDVIDNGIGFDQADADRIFNVFTRLYNNAEYKGTGIGLSIVKRAVQNHEGYVVAQSTPNLGSTFTVYLPYTD